MASSNPFVFVDAEKARDAITAQQQKQISDMYQKWADDIAAKADWYGQKTTASAPLSRLQMLELEKQLREAGKEMSNQMYQNYKQNIYSVADAVVGANNSWMSSLGFNLQGLDAAFSHVPMQTVNTLITGQLYEGGWNLSSAIWSANEKIQGDLYAIMAQGLAENTPLKDIVAKMSQYVQPGARNSKSYIRDAQGHRAFPKSADYNAQRLGKTLLQHSYQQALVATTKDNPFILKYQWISGPTACDLCNDRNGQLYDKNELPLDHPNGNCAMWPVMDDNIIDKLADWVNDPDGTYPEIDAFANKLGGYTPNPAPKTAEEWVNKWGNSQKSWGNWYDHLSATAKAEAKALKDQSGLTWTQWYEKHVYNGQTPIVNGKLVKAPKETLSALQKDWFAKAGYSNGQFPKDFTEFAHKLTYAQQSELLKLAGGSWSDAHPFQKMEAYFNQYLMANPQQQKAMQAALKAAQKKVSQGTGGMLLSTEEYLQLARNNPNVAKMLEYENDVFKALFSSGDVSALTRYTGSSYTEINGYLRDIAKGMSEEAARAKWGSSIADCARACEQALNKTTLGQDLVLRRGTDVGDLAGLFMNGDFSSDKRSLYGKTAEELNAMFAGKIGEYAGFTSTSSQWDRGFSGDVEIVFMAPKDAKAASIMNISQYGTSEGETLLNAGTKVKCERIETSDGHFGSDIRVFLTIITK